ncbi:hypothetical protein ACJRO7_026410 [Eucalyptus globulus]|uniref:Sodium channel modifier 1 zinc-finger domain-containing protein n=1 Tax=Eucalyptus globulus TaxID=34317 RepID=A0ABD3JMP6_EUCGL
MSVFGGDSWAREAQHRKRRVDDLAVEGLDASSYKKLSSGKFACLVCPGAPVLDSALMLSMHCKGSHHRVALSRLKERELKKKDEIDKRIALSDCTVNTGTSTSILNRIKSRPLMEQTRKADVHNNGHSGRTCGNLHGNQPKQSKEHRHLQKKNKELYPKKMLIFRYSDNSCIHDDDQGNNMCEMKVEAAPPLF